ncbi:TorF family putative porin [Xanthomonas sp. H13-6]|uniref:TorF family putative porin n=1 Tax=Xanthomonas chitinilytica TaxID=2989819 RepID=A0ABT3JU79_9XANT|nr:TorF family putative porin [Xanthomonas sp. H13-6]MCW4472050.1 TorF family putative porin [Xanthomonas sp. H13-6]
MMHSKRLVAVACAVLSSASFAVLAQEETSSPISWEIGAVSDYVFRGASQTDENPTGQAGITYTAPFGLYVGTWASGVDFGDGDPDFEVDYFVGYGFDIGDSVNFDVMLNRYTYPGASELNYNELITTTSFAENYSLTVAYSNDVWASDTDGWYYGIGGEWGLPNDFSLSASIGRSTFDSGVAEDYTDWGVGVSKSFGIVSVGLNYYGTDSKGDTNFGKLADDRVVLSVKVSQ